MQFHSYLRRGFTLLELILVTAILVILSGLCLSVISAARKSMNRVQCASNLATIGRAVAAYSGDNGGELPSVYGLDPGGQLKPMTWANIGVHDHGKGVGGVLLLLTAPAGMADHSYVSTANTFLCPSDPELEFHSDGDFIWLHGVRRVKRMSYVYCYIPAGGNGFPWWDYDPQTGRAWSNGGFPQWLTGIMGAYVRHNMSTQRNASQTALFWEPPVWHVSGRPKIDFHSPGGHVLYMDGHVVDVPQHELPQSNGDNGFTVLKQMLSTLSNDN